MKLPVDQTVWKLLDAVPCGCIHCTVHRKSRIVCLACTVKVIYTLCITKSRGLQSSNVLIFVNFVISCNFCDKCFVFVYPLSNYDRRWCNWKHILIINVNDELDIVVTQYITLHNRRLYLMIRNLYTKRHSISLYRPKNMIFLLDYYIILFFNLFSNFV